MNSGGQWQETGRIFSCISLVKTYSNCSHSLAVYLVCRPSLALQNQQYGLREVYCFTAGTT